MTYADNWEELKERYDAWWDGTLSKGPILKVLVLDTAWATELSGCRQYQVQPEWHADAQEQAVKYGMSPAPHYLGLTPEASEETRKQYWLDISGRLHLFQSVLSTAGCYGDAFLHFFPDFGSAVVASFLGPEPRYGSRSMLNESSPLGTLEEIEPHIRFDPESRWWRSALALVRTALDMFEDRVIVGFPNLGGALDILASLRGTQNLLMDLVLDPDAVKRLETKLSQLWIRHYEELYAVIKQVEQEGTTGWVGVWGKGKMFPIQCDIAVMISPDMFQEFAVPSLRIQAQALDHCIFHYHGEGPRETLDHLLDMDEIHAIQWSRGVHDPPYDDEAWLPVYRRITERGKGLLLHEVRPDHIEWLVSRLPAERLAMNVMCESEEEARELLSRYGRV